MEWTPSALSGHAPLSGYKSLPTFGKLLINTSHSQQQVEEVIIEHPHLAIMIGSRVGKVPHWDFLNWMWEKALSSLMAKLRRSEP